MINATSGLPSTSTSTGTSAFSPSAPTMTTTSTMSAGGMSSTSSLRETGSVSTPSSSSTMRGGSGATAPLKPTGKKRPMGMIIGAIVLLLLILGGGIGVYLSGRSAETRQQASVGDNGALLASQLKGYMDSASCGQVKGWVCDANGYSQPLSVAVYYDVTDAAHLAVTTTANVSRPDLNSASGQFCGGTTNHGFDVSIPTGKIPNGSHTLIIQATGVDGTTTFVVGPAQPTISQTVTCNGSTSGAAPTAPVCSLTFNVTPPPATSISCQKTSYRDELSNSAGSYTLVQQQSAFMPGDTIVFDVKTVNNGSAAVNINLTDAIGKVSTNFQFLDSDCGANAYNATTQTLTCPITAAAPGATIDHRFRVKVATNTPNGTTIINTANVQSGSTTASCNATVTVSTTPVPSPSPSPSVAPSPSPTSYTCNSACTTDAQCQTVNAGYVCASNYGNTCRLDSNRGSNTCQAITYTCNSSCTSDSQCQTANTGYVCYNGSNTCRLGVNPTATNCQPLVYVPPSPTVGCNASCATNSDCAASNQICATTSTGQRCRLDNYINSESCTPPSITYIYTPAPVSTPQPVMPKKLPVSGAGDTVRMMLVGAGSLMLGAAALLIL